MASVKRPTRPKLPMKIAEAYYSGMWKLINKMSGYTLKQYDEAIAPLAAEYLQKSNSIREIPTDALNTNKLDLSRLSPDMRRLYDELIAEVNAQLKRMGKHLHDVVFTDAVVWKLAKKFVGKVVLKQKLDQAAAVSAATDTSKETVLGLKPFEDDIVMQQYVNDRISQNVNLIKSIPDYFLGKVKKTIEEGMSKGRSTSDMVEEIKLSTGVAENKAKLIARDQLGSIYGQVKKKRSEDLGLHSFKWRTMQDSRVRDTHEALEGRVFSWDTGAVGEGVEGTVRGKCPGEDYQCRCVAEDIYEELAGVSVDGSNDITQPQVVSAGGGKGDGQ